MASIRQDETYLALVSDRILSFNAEHRVRRFGTRELRRF